MNLYTSMVFSSSLQSNYKISIVYTYLWYHYVPLWLLQPLQYIPEFADDLIDDFPGPANQTRCFTHVLNLVVKSIIRQFDLPNSWADKNQIFDEGTKELLSLAGNIDVEEEEASRDGEDGLLVRKIMLKNGLMNAHCWMKKIWKSWIKVSSLCD